MTTLGRSTRREAPRAAAPPGPTGLPRILREKILTAAARPLRFAAVGGLCGLLQLAVLVALKQLSIAAVTANIGAYLVSAQVNFLLSHHFIWHDRRPARAGGAGLLRRWLGFHASIAGTFVLSQTVFILARFALPDVVASALGIGISALANFVIQDRLTFSRSKSERSAGERIRRRERNTSLGMDQ
jgi:putative flippase GtrA